MSTSSGQIFTTDLVASAFVFIILLNMGLLALDQAQDRQNRFDQEHVMQRKTFQTTSLLVRTEGYPADWTPATVEIIGLAGPDHVLQQRKINDFAAMDYNTARAIMDLDRYDFFVNITTPSYHQEIGISPTNPNDVTIDRRAAVVNTTNLFEQGTIKVLLWE